MVVPPGEQTASFKAPGCWPEDRTSLAGSGGHLGRELQRLSPRQAAGHASVRQSLNEKIYKGGATAGNGAAGVHK